MSCDEQCRQQLAITVCALLRGGSSSSAAPHVEMAGDFHISPLLGHRRNVLLREMECDDGDADGVNDHENHAMTERDLVPALQGKAVENGKSAMSFLVPGGRNVHVDDSSTFSAIFKQVNDQEATLLHSLSPQLSAHYSRLGGSMLTPLLAWMRYTSPGEKPFQVLMMDNVARSPPGRGGRHHSSDASSATGWKPFDMKGIRRYSHERRFIEAFGSQGLRIGAAQYHALQAALAADVAFLSERNLVDFSYLLTVFPTQTQPRPCERVWRDADYHARSGWAAAEATTAEQSRGRGALLPASYELRQDPPPDLPASRHGSPRAGEGTGLCMGVLVRVSIIDYLREWSMAERVEHVQKTLMRDLIAGERNHAVVPVSQFAKRFAVFFSEALFTPLPYPTENLAGWLSMARFLARDVLHFVDGAMTAVQETIASFISHEPRDHRSMAGEACMRLRGLLKKLYKGGGAPMPRVDPEVIEVAESSASYAEQ